MDHLTQTLNTTGEVATAVVALFVGITALLIASYGVLYEKSYRNY